MQAPLLIRTLAIAFGALALLCAAIAAAAFFRERRQARTFRNRVLARLRKEE